jgi:hypothetical protein
MPEQPLDLVKIHARLNEPRGEGMPEIVEVEILDLGPAQR